MSNIASVSGWSAARGAPDSVDSERVVLEAADVVVAAVLAVAALLLYGMFALRLASGHYLDYYNLAFDFDPPRFVHVFALSPPDPDPVFFKHPLILLLRPLDLPFRAIGLDAKAASALLMASFGGGTVAMCFLFLRAIRADRLVAAALGVLFMLTGTPLFTSIIVESYGPAAFGITALWLLTAARLADGRSRVWQRYAIAVLCLGVTITNVMQVFVAELLVSLRSAGLVEAIRRAVIFGFVLLAIAVVLAVAIWHQELAAIASDPVLALKQVYWLQPKGEREGALKLLETFIAYSFVSPEWSFFHWPEGIEMPDFRAWRFSPVGGVAVWAWLVFFVAGLAGALVNRRTRWLAGGMAAALVLNIAFHLDYQSRGSLYIYAAHMHFLVFGLACGLAPMVAQLRWARAAYLGVVLVLATLIGSDNLPVVNAFTQMFDNAAASGGGSTAP